MELAIVRVTPNSLDAPKQMCYYARLRVGKRLRTTEKATAEPLVIASVRNV